MRRYSIGWTTPAQDGHVRVIARDARGGPVIEEIHVTGRVPLAWFATLDPVADVAEMRAEARREGAA